MAIYYFDKAFNQYSICFICGNPIYPKNELKFNKGYCLINRIKVFKDSYYVQLNHVFKKHYILDKGDYCRLCIIKEVLNGKK